MWESSTEISTIDRTMSIRFGGVYVFASWTVEFYRFLVWCVRKTNGEEGLRVAEYARTSSKVGFAVLVELMAMMEKEEWREGGQSFRVTEVNEKR